jgi:hypothetical protein
VKDLTFEPEKHEYRYKGVRVPSVSEIIAPIRDYSGIDPAILANAARRGTAVHFECELYDKGMSGGLKSMDAELRPYFSAYLRFLEEHDCEWLYIEEPGYIHELGVAGTPDRFGTVDGFVAGLDLKATAKKHAATGVQIAGYEMMVPQFEVQKRYGLRLKRDGTYELTEYPDERVTFRSLVNVWKWRQRNLP